MKKMILFCTVLFSLYCPNAYCSSGEADTLYNGQDSGQKMKTEGNSIESKLSSKWRTPPRLFSIPASGVLGVGEFEVSGGSAIGVEGGESPPRSLSVSMGGRADIEFSSFSLFNNISSSARSTGASAFKAKLINREFQNSYYEVSTGLLSSGSWEYISSDYSEIQKHADWVSQGIYSINYNTRFTVLFLVAGIKNRNNYLYVGGTLSDVRVKDMKVYSDLGELRDRNEELQRNLWGGFIGFDFPYDERTHLIGEVKNIFHYSYNDSLNRIDVRQKVSAIIGVRHNFTRWIALDAGIGYGSRFKGLADAKIKLGLSLVVPLGELIDTAARKKKEEQLNHEQ